MDETVSPSAFATLSNEQKMQIILSIFPANVTPEIDDDEETADV